MLSPGGVMTTVPPRFSRGQVYCMGPADHRGSQMATRALTQTLYVTWKVGVQEMLARRRENFLNGQQQETGKREEQGMRDQHV